MANAFSPGRVSLWHTSPKGLNPDYTKVKNLGVTDVFVPVDQATRATMDDIRSRPSADGKNFRAQCSIDGTHGDPGADLAKLALDRLPELKPGVYEINVEAGNDGDIGETILDFHRAFRGESYSWRWNFPLCFNVVPMKGYVLPLAILTPDPNAYVRVQRFYGAEMRPAEPALCREDIVGRGFPEDRFSFMESAKPRRLIDGSLFIDLPVFSDRGEHVRNLSGGAIFNANLLREAGLA